MGLKHEAWCQEPWTSTRVGEFDIFNSDECYSH